MSKSNSAIIARQPILDREGKLFAYELLFRDFNDKNEANVFSDVMATSRVLINTLNNFGIKNVLGSALGFINVNEELIDMGVLESLESEQFVLEILETSELSEESINKIKALKEDGYTIALDDFDFSPKMFEQFKEVLSLIDILKVDLMECNWSELPEMMSRIKPLNIKVLAEKVETKQEHEKCLKLGFDLFQGYYYSKPVIIEGKKISNSVISTMKLIQLMQKNCETADIVEEFKRHPDITVALLRYMNSAANSVGRAIESIQQAVTLLGRRKLSRWLMLMIYAEGGNSSSSDPKEDPVYLLASQRAKTMENLLEHKFGLKDQGLLDKAFLCGVLSLMDTLLGVSLEDLAQEFNVDSDIEMALLENKGPLGQYMGIIRKQDSVDNHQVFDLAEAAQLQLEDISDAYLKAYKWVETQ